MKIKPGMIFFYASSLSSKVVAPGDNVEGVAAALDIATKKERRDMLQMMLDAVYTDMPTKQVVERAPSSHTFGCFKWAAKAHQNANRQMSQRQARFG